MSLLSSFVDHLFGINNGAPAQAANTQQQTINTQQQAHDSAVAAGKSNIDSAFSQFSPDYFKGITNSYEDSYNPQLTDQFSIARDQLTSALAGNDTLGSTAGANATSQLQKQYNTSQSDIASKGQDAANTAQSTVNNEKNNLYSLNQSAADPLAAQTSAQAATGALVSPTEYPSLGNVFGAALSPIASATKTAAGSPYYPNPNAGVGFGSAPIGGNGSGVIG